MKGKVSLAVSMIALTAVSGGCLSRAIKEGVDTPKGMAVSLKQGTAARAAYNRFKLDPLADDMGGLAPPALFQALPGKFEKALADKQITNAPTGKTLLIRGKVIYYESSGLFGQLFGPLEEVIARVEFVDADTKEVIAEANCIGRTKSSRLQGVEKKAEALANAIVNWIDKNVPKEQ